MNVFDELKARGMIAQLTHEDKIREKLENEKVTFYIGFDPTADSLHIGHFVQMMVMAHMQRAGHRPIAILGGGTAMVGDPTGKTDMRRMMSEQEIQDNVNAFQKQLSKFIDFSDGKALLLNNKDWLANLNYINFLREIGVHFSVNRMLTAECFKTRLEKGLSFIEFNYMLMQSYDFLKLNDEYNCCLELGGDDQWSNIIGGIELIRRARGKESYGMTFALLTTSEGKKMGKTEKGALWLNREKTSPFDFYQYFRNVDDADVIKCLKLLTFLPLDQINELAKLEGKEINEAKKVLAFEVTKLIHGEQDAIESQNAAQALFETSGNGASMPTKEVHASVIGEGIGILELLLQTKIIPSKSEGKRLIEQGGLYIEGERITGFDHMVTLDSFVDGKIIVRRGKKKFDKLILI